MKKKSNSIQRMIGFLIGIAFSTMSIFAFYTCSSGEFLDVPTVIRQEVPNSNIEISRIIDSCTKEIKLSREDEIFKLDLNCCLTISTDFVLSSDGKFAYFDTYCKCDSSQIHYLILPDKNHPLSSVKEETLFTSADVKNSLDKKRAWPVDVIDISPDGNKLLVNIQYSEQTKHQRREYYRRPFLYEIDKKSFFMIEPEFEHGAEQTLPGDN